MKFKRIIAIGLAAIMSISMTATAFAAEQQEDFWDLYPNLTNYDTEYSYTVPYSETEAAEPIYLKVQAISKDWKTKSFFENVDQALSIHWTFADGTDDPAITFPSRGVAPVTGGFVAQTSVTVGAGATPGVHIIEASNDYGGYMDFTILVNPTKEVNTVSNISVRIYEGAVSGGTPLQYQITDAAVSSGHLEYAVNYPTALDALITATTVEGVEHSKIVYDEETATYMVEEIAGKANEGLAGWLYKVYDKNGDPVALSEDVGAGIYSLKEGDVVVWAYGTYEDTNLFPAKYTV